MYSSAKGKFSEDSMSLYIDFILIIFIYVVNITFRTRDKSILKIGIRDIKNPQILFLRK